MDLRALQANYTPMQIDAAASMPPPDKKKGNLFTSLLPTALSIAGGTLGSVFAPGVGTAAGGAGGAVLGKKLQDMLTGNHSGLGSYLGEAAFGSLGGIGKAASSIKGAGAAIRAGEGLADAGKVLRYGEEGAKVLKAAPQAVTIADKALAATEANAKGAGKVLQGVEGEVANANNAGGLLGKLQTKISKVGDKSMLGQTNGLSRGTADAAVRDTGKLRSLGYSDFEKAAEHAPFVTGDKGIVQVAKNGLIAKGAPIESGSFKDMARGVISNNPEINGAAEKKVLGILDKTANKYGFQGDKVIGQTSAKNYDLARRELSTIAYDLPPTSPVRKGLINITNQMRTPVEESLAGIPLTKEVKDGMIASLRSSGVKNAKLEQAITKASSASELSAIEAPFVTASKAGKESATASVRAGFGGIAPNKRGIIDSVFGVVQKPAQKGITMGANTSSSLLSKLTGAGAELPTTLSGVAGQTAKSMAKMQVPARLVTGQYGQGQAEAQPPVDPMSAGGMDPAMAGLPSSTGGLSSPGGQFAPNDPSQDTGAQLMAAAQHALASGDTKGLENIMKVYSLYESQAKLAAAGGGKKLNSTAAQNITDMEAGLASLNELGNDYAKSNANSPIPLLGKLRGMNPYDTGAQQLQARTATVKQLIGKALEGGVLRKEDEIKYAKILPTLQDSDATAQYKIQTIASDLQRKLAMYKQNLGGGDGGVDVDSLLASQGAMQ